MGEGPKRSPPLEDVGLLEREIGRPTKLKEK
jgi:hypothetical protein